MDECNSTDQHSNIDCLRISTILSIQKNSSISKNLTNTTTSENQISKLQKNVAYQRTYRKRRDFDQEKNLSDSVLVSCVKEHYSGEMKTLCKHCNAKHFQAEKVNKMNSFNDCCKHGEVILKDLPNPPAILQSLFDGTHTLSNYFHENILRYNN